MSGRDAMVRTFGWPNSVTTQFDFWDDKYEGRRLFSEVLGTFFLVLVAAGAGMVNARFGGGAVPGRGRRSGAGADGDGDHPVHGRGVRRALESGREPRVRAAR